MVKINNIIGKHVKIPIRNFFKSNDNFNNELPPLNKIQEHSLNKF